MKLNRINQLNYKSSIVFGEIEGGYFENNSSCIPKNNYELKKKQINDKFSSLRDNFIKNSDCSEPSPEVFWKHLNEIEMMRARALKELDTTCNKCKSKKWSILRFFKLK